MNKINNLITLRWNQDDQGVNSIETSYENHVLISYTHLIGCPITGKLLTLEHKSQQDLNYIDKFVIEIYNDVGPQNIPRHIYSLNELKNGVKEENNNINIICASHISCFERKNILKVYFNSIHPGIDKYNEIGNILYLDFYLKYRPKGTIIPLNNKMDNIEISNKIKTIIINFIYQ